MGHFLAELREYSTENLFKLLDAYLVRDHLGQEYMGPMDQNEILTFIQRWLEPDIGIVYQDNLINAIKSGYRVKLTPSKSLLSQVFGSLDISYLALEDFENYPMRDFFGSSWNLLKGYVNSLDREKYFLDITGVNPDKFLNHTEQVFYLTRGYGRPNKYMSNKDVEGRDFYSQASSSSLISLMDIFNICPTNQDPKLIREQLSSINLGSIDRYHRNAVNQVSICLEGVCEKTGCQENGIRCFQTFLESLGILPIVEWDVINEVLVSNLCQLNLYREVIPDKRWNFKEVKNMDNDYIQRIIFQLSDRELLNIEVFEYRFKDVIDLSQLGNRIRSNLVQSAKEFLLNSQFILQDDNIFYGRLVDYPPKEINLDELISSFRQHSDLIGPDREIYSIDEIHQLAEHLNNHDLKDIIYQGRANQIRRISNDNS